jgi:hypothetical protein
MSAETVVTRAEREALTAALEAFSKKAHTFMNGLGNEFGAAISSMADRYGIAAVREALDIFYEDRETLFRELEHLVADAKERLS